MHRSRHNQSQVLRSRQARVLLRGCVNDMHESRHTLPCTADVCPHPHDIDLTLIQSGGCQTIRAQQLVCELLAFRTRDVVLSASRGGGDVGRPGDAVDTLRQAGFVVEVQDVVLFALPRALRYVFRVLWLGGGTCSAV